MFRHLQVIQLLEYKNYTYTGSQQSTSEGGTHGKRTTRLYPGLLVGRLQCCVALMKKHTNRTKLLSGQSEPRQSEEIATLEVGWQAKGQCKQN